MIREHAIRIGMNDFIPAIPDWFNTRKAAQVVAFFAIKLDGKINILRATKLVYLADRLSMSKREHPITGDNFVSMKFGPVNTYTYSYMCGQASVRQDEWATFMGARSGHDLPLAKKIDVGALDELSRSDVAILEATWAEYKDIEKFKLAEWTHKFCPEWRDPNGSSIPIDFATVFKHLKKDDPVELAEEIQAERQLIASLHEA